MNGLENASGGHRGHLAVDAVQRSQLAVTVKSPTASATVRCPLKGNGITEGKSGSRLYHKGLIVACEVPIAPAGKHAVSASVVWDPAIKPLSAKAVVRDREGLGPIRLARSTSRPRTRASPRRAVSQAPSASWPVHWTHRARLAADDAGTGRPSSHVYRPSILGAATVPNMPG